MAESTDKFGVGVWDRWEFARELGAGRYPESSDAGTGRAAADVAFFNGDFGMAADLYKALSEHHPGNRGILARMLHCYDATCDWQAREPIADALTAALDIEPDLNGTEPLCYLSIPLSNRKAFEFVKARNARYGNKSTPLLPANQIQKRSGSVIFRSTSKPITAASRYGRSSRVTITIGSTSSVIPLQGRTRKPMSSGR